MSQSRNEPGRSLFLGLLGPWVLRHGDRQILRLPDKAKGLLAYLAVQPGGAATREKLALMLWPEGTDQTARANLRNALFEIRRAVGPGAQDFLPLNAFDVALARQRLDIDLAHLEAAARSRDPAVLAAAAGLYRDEFLANLRFLSEPFEEWVLEQRARVRRLAGEVLSRLCETASAAGRHQQAIEAAHRWVALDPLDEASQRGLMRCYAQAGRRAAALRQYRDCAAVLRRELDIAPQEETSELARAIERKDPTAAAAPEPNATAIVRAPVDRREPADPSPLERMLTRSWGRPDRLTVGFAPIRNLSDNPTLDIVADGLTEDLLTDLAQLGHAFTMCRMQGHAAEPVSWWGSDVSFVVAGNVQTAGAKLRLSIQLIEPRSGQYLWAHRAEPELAALGMARADLVARLSQQLHVQVLLAASRAALTAAGEQPSVDWLIARGMSEMAKDEAPHPRHDAQMWFLRALAIDSRNPDALTGIAHCCQRIASQPYWSPSADVTASALDLGREAVQAALAIDDRRAYAWTVSAGLASVGGDLERAQCDLRQALDRDPRNALAHAFGGYNAAFLGKAGETLAGVERALRIAPRHPARPIWLFLAGAGALLQGKPDEASTLFERSLSANGQYGSALLWSALAHRLAGKDRAAASVLHQFRERFPGYRVRDFNQQYVLRSENPIYRRQIGPIFDQLCQFGLPD